MLKTIGGSRFFYVARKNRRHSLDLFEAKIMGNTYKENIGAINLATEKPSKNKYIMIPYDLYIRGSSRTEHKDAHRA